MASPVEHRSSLAEESAVGRVMLVLDRHRPISDREEMKVASDKKEGEREQRTLGQFGDVLARRSAPR